MSVMLLDETRAGSLIEGLCKMNQMWNTGTFIECTNEGKLYHDGVKKFIRKLYQANLATWNRKYDESDTILDILPSTGAPFTQHQTLKTLQCLHYNIEEEYVPTAKKLLEQAGIMINEIKSNIITKMPEYDTAEWG